MPFVRRWPFYVSQTVLDDRRAALEDLERASGGLKDTAARTARVDRVTDSLARARERNGFSEAMESLFASAPRARRPGPEQQ